MEYIAHRIQETGEDQTVIEHLTNTANMAKEFAEAFQSGDEGYFCGMLHDIGKYSTAFQERITRSAIRVDHSSAGAVEAAGLKDVAAALCIAGHHGGLPDMGTRADGSGDGTLCGIAKRRAGKELEDYSAYAKEVSIPKAAPPRELVASPEDAFFYVHMLYSALVDADWLDTEQFMSAGSVQRGTGETIEELSKKLDEYVSKWWGATEQLNACRCEILRGLMEAGEREKGLYTLTVPTGGGKTISSMAFALRHAMKNQQRRIIYVIPYTSIIEQTQKVFEDIFGAENVVAHYANIEYKTDEFGAMSDCDRRRYLASENWDAPIILTTAVQFFESVFGNRSSRCRKLHNIAQSVIVFDEAQMLPVNYLMPCVWSITRLVKNYGCTAVLCTATQPALSPLMDKLLPGYEVKELCQQKFSKSDIFRRTNYQCDGKISNDELARRLNKEKQTLCIVNSRRQAQEMFSMLEGDGAFHLSTTMYPAHRRAVLDTIRKRLSEGLPCRVVSTSLVEAGVDVDFPCVYRAVAGLDSIIQAGGRCNREGKRPSAESVVHVFETEERIPASMRQNISAAKRVMGLHEDIASTEAISDYFNFLLYDLAGTEALDEKKIMRLIKNDMAFDTVAKNFHLIENNTRTVYIPIDEGETLTRQLITDGPNRKLIRKLGQYAVSVYDTNYRKLDEVGALQQVSENAAVLLNPDYYNENTGLALSAEGGEALFS